MMKFQLRRVLMGVSLLTGLLLTFGLAVDIYARRSYETLNDVQWCKNQLNGKSFARTELFFGLSKSDGSVISEQEFQQFIDRKITPLFPEGLTLLTGAGQFQTSTGTVTKERSKLLILLYPSSTDPVELGGADRTRAVEQIRDAYKTAFKQESVLRVDEQACASF